MFVNWEGRVRPFEAALRNPSSLPDLRILSGIAEEMGAPLGFRTVAEVRAEMAQLGPWDGEHEVAEFAREVARSQRGRTLRDGRRDVARTGDFCVLATWKQSIDNGRMQDGDKYLKATARTRSRW